MITNVLPPFLWFTVYLLARVWDSDPGIIKSIFQHCKIRHFLYNLAHISENLSDISENFAMGVSLNKKVPITFRKLSGSGIRTPHIDFGSWPDWSWRRSALSQCPCFNLLFKSVLWLLIWKVGYAVMPVNPICLLSLSLWCQTPISLAVW